ncbi:MAG: hypothetical protein GY708_25605 [Actinomycetia bacterium]|nr:hypothetical protein [Actinomycetes bacterium]MCP4961779.1 hypothetical protein [Actinomycetes bacterium]
MDRARVEELMTLMADGDVGAMAEFRICFGANLKAAARWHARQFGWTLDEGDVASMATQFALEIADRAASWQPGRALPWTWASRRFREVVRLEWKTEAADWDYDALPDHAHPRLSASTDPDVIDLVHELADEDARVRALLEWTENEGISARDLKVWIEFRQQKNQGDPSPSKTVAGMTGLSPSNVRQVAHRVTTRAVRANLAIAA